MGDPLKLQQQALGLEVWAIGTAVELDVLRAVLAANGSFLQRPEPPTPLGGGDRGRYRQYLRVHTRTAS